MGASVIWGQNCQSSGEFEVLRTIGDREDPDGKAEATAGGHMWIIYFRDGC